MTPSGFLSNLHRFWSKVDTSGDCWLWTGQKNNHGYGRFVFWHEGTGTRIFAHRLAVMLAGGDLQADDVVMHTCDTPACVRVDHLRVGTQRDNIHDALDKNRMDMSGLAIGRLPHAERVTERQRRKLRHAQRGAA